MKIVVCLSLMASAVAANALGLFDGFSENQNAVVLTGVGTASNTVSFVPVSRKQELSVIAYNDPDEFERAYSRVSGGYWIGSSDVDVQGVWNMIYTAPASVISNLNAFQLDFSSIDHYSVVTVTLSSGSSTATGQANVIASNSLQQVVVNATNVGSGFDWNNVTSIMFTIDGPAGLDFKIDQIQAEAVPEPASIIALGLGGLALIRRKRRA